jgi:hypothetical protein
MEARFGVQTFPNISLAVLGDFNGLDRKKFGKEIFRRFLRTAAAPAAFTTHKETLYRDQSVLRRILFVDIT